MELQLYIMGIRKIEEIEGGLIVIYFFNLFPSDNIGKHRNQRYSLYVNCLSQSCVLS